VVTLAMSILFIRPAASFFLLGAFVATPVMALVSLWLTGYKDLFKPSTRSISIGVLSSILLYGVFYAGNEFIRTFKPLGIGSSGEASIYSTIGSHPIYLQVVILALDAFGFESYFRGSLQNFLSSVIASKRTSGVLGVFLAALCDSLIHIISLNPLWMITTLVADSVWGMTYYYTRDLGSSMVSHLIWDLVIFIIAPIG
jgi:membrane protease YdiL (CAAX protease family)